MQKILRRQESCQQIRVTFIYLTNRQTRLSEAEMNAQGCSVRHSIQSSLTAHQELFKVWGPHLSLQKASEWWWQIKLINIFPNYNALKYLVSNLDGRWFQGLGLWSWIFWSGWKQSVLLKRAWESHIIISHGTNVTLGQMHTLSDLGLQSRRFPYLQKSITCCYTEPQFIPLLFLVGRFVFFQLNPEKGVVIPLYESQPQNTW